MQLETTTVNNLTRTARRRRCDALYPKIRKETRDEPKQGMMDKKRHRNEMRTEGGVPHSARKNMFCFCSRNFGPKQTTPATHVPAPTNQPPNHPSMLTNKWNQPTLVPLGGSDIPVLRYAAAPPSLHAAQHHRTQRSLIFSSLPKWSRDTNR